MEDAQVGLHAALRALGDVVAPAVDPANAQAREQLRLSMDYIAFVAARLDHFQDRALFDLRHYLSMARELRDCIANRDPATGERLDAAIRRSQASLPEFTPSLQALRGAAADLAAAVADTVRDSVRFDDALRADVERAVLKTSEAWIDFERAWHLPLGLDHDAARVPELRELLDPTRRAKPPIQGGSPE